MLQGLADIFQSRCKKWTAKNWKACRTPFDAVMDRFHQGLIRAAARHFRKEWGPLEVG